jgi:hypothetical protein
MHGCRFKVMDASKEAFLKARSSGGRLEIGRMVPSTVYGHAYPRQIKYSLVSLRSALRCRYLAFTFLQQRFQKNLVSRCQPRR